ncbi:asparagine synthase (glutamine-hydrolyzing) [Aceticella autotrophica]|uniref:asparagine synthase (glutamine-hydrolyzing) n=1 Tax=Aceticella autotrophica TaxID=2755338 RepID=A0A975GA01_9THEO|nr:asparagine synthase (glutamine-hydrolyzing) [Aceticella autotrophica]QSZ26697.1 asparagine synthase (glutamine-hydrolyzing) [Aceticella autotrophica]
MCGICGFTGDIAGFIGRRNLEEMLGIIRHRGPDDEGIYSKGETGLGIRRLSILDIKSGHQPIHNEKKNIWVVCNGEIYNFQSLKRSLMIKGHEFYTNSDTEVIVHLYEEYGEKFVLYLNGMFAIAIYDETRKKLMLARDRLGVKPLYYILNNRTIVFASEIKALLMCNILDTELNYNKLGTYLKYRYIPGEQTLFKNIYKLMPGYILIYANNKIKTNKYWDITFKDDNNAKEELYYRENISKLFSLSVEDRLISDVPLGIFLSGGLDSTIVLSEALKFYDKRLKTFSVGFEKPLKSPNLNEYNELNYAKKVADFYGTEHYEYIIKPKEVLEDLNRIIWHLDEPLSDPTSIPLYYLSKLAKRHVKVVLSGEGADEVFAGYTIYKEPEVIKRYRKIPGFIRNYLIEPINLCMPFNYGKDFIKRAKLSVEERYKGVGLTFKDCEISAILSSDLYANSIIEDKGDQYIPSIFNNFKSRDEVNMMLFFDQKVWLPEDVLMKSDKISMSNSIELRVPFLDYKLVEYAASIPSNLKYKGDNEKYILKEAFKDNLPDFVLNRKKNGFPVPITSLLKKEYREFVMDILLSQTALNRGYFNKSYIEGYFNGVNTGNNTGRQIWLLLTFELWHRMFIDNKINKSKENIYIA